MKSKELPEVFILAGGLGTRLASVLKDVIPKPMAPIKGVPFLEYLILYLRNQGFSKFCIMVGHKAQSILDYFEDGSKFSVEIRYQREATPLGTGGAIKKALEESNQPFGLVLNGDTFFSIDYQAFVEYCNGQSGIALSFCENNLRYGFVEIRDDYKISSFSEKKSDLDGFINAGVYYLASNTFKDFCLNSFSFERDFLEKYPLKFLGIPSAGFFIDIGVPEDYNLAQTKIPERFDRDAKKCAFLDRDGVVLKYFPYLKDVEKVELNTGLTALIKFLKEKGFVVGMISNQAGVAKGLISEQQHDDVHNRMLELLQKHSINLDFFEYCKTHENGTVDGLNKKSVLRKPQPGMVCKASNAFDIDICESFMIGDNISDVLKMPLLKTFLVKSDLNVFKSMDGLQSFHSLDELLFYFSENL